MCKYANVHSLVCAHTVDKCLFSGATAWLSGFDGMERWNGMVEWTGLDLNGPDKIRWVRPTFDPDIELKCSGS